MGARERYVIVEDDGSIWLYEENDGPRYMRKGAQETKERVESISKLPLYLQKSAAEQIGKMNATRK